MNAGVTLVEACLRLNGYFTATEIPVIQRDGTRGFKRVTDIGVIAVRFPWASFLVSDGDSGPKGDRELGSDPRLAPVKGAVDIVIGEVKEGRPSVNSALRSDEALRTALARVGCLPLDRTQETIELLRARGEATMNFGDPPMSARVRIVAFGDGEGDPALGLLHLMNKTEDD